MALVVLLVLVVLVMVCSEPLVDEDKPHVEEIAQALLHLLVIPLTAAWCKHSMFAPTCLRAESSTASRPFCNPISWKRTPP